MTPTDVIGLLNDPEKLFRRAYISIAGGQGHMGANGQAALSLFKVEVNDKKPYPGFTSGLSGMMGKTKDRPIFKVTRIGPAQTPPPADHFNAFYIPMVQTGDVASGNSHYNLPTNTPTKIAITSQITACVFSVGKDAGGSVLVSHVQPPAAATGLSHDARQTAAVTAGGQNMAIVKQFKDGSDYSYRDDVITIMGVLNGTTWDFYSQKLSKSGDSFAVRSGQKFVSVSEDVQLP